MQPSVSSTVHEDYHEDGYIVIQNCRRTQYTHFLSHFKPRCESQAKTIAALTLSTGLYRF